MGVSVMAIGQSDQYEPFRISMIGTSHCAEDYHILRENAPVFVIEYVLNGSGSVTDGDRTFVVNKGDAYFLHAGNHHEIYPVGNQQWRKIWMNFHGELAAALTKCYKLDEISYFPKLNILPHMEEIHQILSNFDNLHEAYDRCVQVFVRILQQMYKEVYLKPSTKLTLAEEIKEYIDNYPGADISLDDLSQRIHCSKSYAIRTFRKKYNMTPYVYIQKKKIELAKNLLTETALSVNEISEQLGFCDSHYFSRFFKQNEQTSPATYRKNHKKTLKE